MPSTKTPPITLLTGPTGSGKSALALAAAQLRPTVIINADAMQMVATLRTLTARPTEAEEQQAEHALYGVLPPESPTSVAVWLALVAPAIRRAWAEGKAPLLVGGTGMYLKALMEGLAAVPPIPEAIRSKVRSWADASCVGFAKPPSIPSPIGGGLGWGQDMVAASHHPDNNQPPASSLQSPSLHTRLAACDPLMAGRLKPGDTQRILRALEVVEATGTSLADWQEKKHKPLFPCSEFRTFYVDIPRPIIYHNIDRRFTSMMDRGALDEVRQLMELNLPPDTPILRAHGVPELIAHLRGTLSLEAAITKAQQHTRNYAKRQMTWIRNQLPTATALPHDLPPARAAARIFTGL